MNNARTNISRGKNIEHSGPLASVGVLDREWSQPQRGELGGWGDTILWDVPGEARHSKNGGQKSHRNKATKSKI
jgi:hypothetical protein